MSGEQQQQQQQQTTDQNESTQLEVGGQGAADEPVRSGEYHYGLYKFQTRFDPISIAFALLVFIGGIIGYVSKQSSVSLIAGTIFFILLAAATFVEGSRKNPYPLLLTLAVLGGMMAYRYGQSGTFMPSGLVAALAIIMIARHSYLIYLRRQPVSSA